MLDFTARRGDYTEMKPQGEEIARERKLHGWNYFTRMQPHGKGRGTHKKGVYKKEGTYTERGQTTERRLKGEDITLKEDYIKEKRQTLRRELYRERASQRVEREHKRRRDNKEEGKGRHTWRGNLRGENKQTNTE